MTEDKALDLAQEALKLSSVTVDSFGVQRKIQEAITAITAIKQARALDKKAENARELGLDYEPVAPVREDWGPGPHECHSLTSAPVQKRFELIGHADLGINNIYIFNGYGEEVPEGRTPLYASYTTPPAAQRQWVGLTQQDIDIAFDDTQEGGGFDEFARAIEAKLKEKNT